MNKNDRKCRFFFRFTFFCMVLALASCARLQVKVDIFDTTDKTTCAKDFWRPTPEALQIMQVEDQNFRRTVRQEIHDLQAQVLKAVQACYTHKDGTVEEGFTKFGKINIQESFSEMNAGFDKVSSELEGLLAVDVNSTANNFLNQKAKILAKLKERQGVIADIYDRAKRSIEFQYNYCAGLLKQEAPEVKFDTKKIENAQKSLGELITMSSSQMDAQLATNSDLKKQAAKITVISAVDPNLPVLLRDKNEKCWRPAGGFAKGFITSGSGHILIVQNTLTDYRVKSVKNDITKTVQGFRAALEEGIRTVGAIYGVPAGGTSQGEADETSGTSGDMESVSSVQADVKLANKNMEELRSIRKELRAYVVPKVAEYEATNDLDIKKQIVNEIIGKLEDATQRIKAITEKSQSNDAAGSMATENGGDGGG